MGTQIDYIKIVDIAIGLLVFLLVVVGVSASRRKPNSVTIGPFSPLSAKKGSVTHPTLSSSETSPFPQTDD